MDLSFPYHDPSGKYNELLKNTVEDLKNIFQNICISVTPQTVDDNELMINFLTNNGFLIFKNNKSSTIGDHYRNALALTLNCEGSDVYFGFIDRILFALNTDFRDQFIGDINKQFNSLTLFERSELAWTTHPQNYRQIEQLTNKLGAFLLGNEIELATCGFLIKKELARKILGHSSETNYSAGTEWILLAHSFGLRPEIKKVDWLSWEDPFIENKNAIELKNQKENDKTETIKRLEMNIPFIDLLAQKRFQKIISG